MNASLLETSNSLKLYDLLDEFMVMLRSGKGIPVSEFAKRHPDHADEIIAHFPALLMAEGWKPRLSSETGSATDKTVKPPPELLAGYRVLRQIGKGGMGVVYQAEHSKLSRKLAIKVLLGQKGHSGLSERFRREAEAASTLNHPNIVPVYDFGEQSGVQYLVMPLIEGASLDRLFEAHRSHAEFSARNQSSTRNNASKCDDSPPDSVQAADNPGFIGPKCDFKRLARLGADVASALAHAHENNTIHRDIKPGNLILDNEGKIWITDFGLAKVRDDGSDLSRTGDVIGTPRFMAPEQMRGLCDERSDVYSLGVTLYELASGNRAWDSLTSAQLLTARATAELPELAEHAPYVPKPLAEIIMKACSFRPEDRYQSAKEMQIVLNRFAHGQKTGDRRRRSRSEGSAFHRKRTVAGLLVLVPTVTLLTMYFFNAGPWATENNLDPLAKKAQAQDALISLVEDETMREKVIQELPDIIEAALDSKDERVREQASDLTLKVFEQTLLRNGAEEEKKDMILGRFRTAAEDYRKNGMQYSDFDHPLSNAVRNLDLAAQVSTLNLNAMTSITCKFRIVRLGDLLKDQAVTDSQIQSLLKLLPEEAQSGPVNLQLERTPLLAFMHLLDDVYNNATRPHDSGWEGKLSQVIDNYEKTQALNPSRRDLSNAGITIPDNIRLPDGLKIPDELKQKLMRAAEEKQRANSNQ